MINYKNNNNRINKFRTNNRNFRANGSNISNLGLKSRFQRRGYNRQLYYLLKCQFYSIFFPKKNGIDPQVII